MNNDSNVNSRRNRTADGGKKSVVSRRTFIGLIIGAVSAANVIVYGIRNGWWRQKLRISIKGPFVDDSTVAIKTQDSSFVVPHDLRVSVRDDAVAKLNVAFTFNQGEKDDNDVILKVVLRDPRGNRLGSRELRCTDGRSFAESPVRYGSTIIQLSRVNSEALKIRLPKGTTIRDISEVDLTFERT